jgi:hypothetical protein
MILISGFKRSGKDTLCNYILEFNSNAKRYAFADALKQQIRNFALEQYNIDILNCNDKDKEIIRPLLIAHGEIRRKLNPLYWVENVYHSILKDIQENNKLVPVISDIRYANEAEFFLSRFSNSVLVEVRREGNEKDAPESEKIAQPLVTPLAHYIMDCPNFNGNIDSLKTYAEKFYNFYINQNK